MIEEFSCAKDTDVETFLKEQAIRYERDGLSRTYLYITSENDDPAIAAFFSVAITSTEFPGVTKSRKAKILGGKPGRDTKDHFGGILVAQLGRSDAFAQGDINGHEMIEDAEYVIERGCYYLGGKVVYLDCREPLIGFYEQNGYALVKPELYPSGYFKMFKSLHKL
ncbi:MAG: hypothetical protein LBR44_00150 [Clostridiales Family XIII bacterium]|nr:hypothetical protein [Clostridiales Family XIII bacterium]